MPRDPDHAKLLALGPDALATALLRLAAHDARTDAFVQRLLATPDERVARFYSDLDELATFEPYFGGDEINHHFQRILVWLDDLAAEIHEPKIGLTLLVAFFRADKDIVPQFDDEGGLLFSDYGCATFVNYAARCDDKDWVIELLLALLEGDEFGVRESLLNNASDYLPASALRHLINQLQRSLNHEADPTKSRHILYQMADLARQLNDPVLFETLHRQRDTALSRRVCNDLAEMYLQAGNAEQALVWLNQEAPGVEHASRREPLILAAYDKLGRHQDRDQLALTRFRQHRTAQALDTFLAIVGIDDHASVIADEVDVIEATSQLNLWDLEFLSSIGQWDAAERYLLARASQIDGDEYHILEPLTQAMERNHRPLCAALLYRRLLSSILGRGRSSAYHHGASYLSRLDELNRHYPDLPLMPDHDAYVHELKRRHARKRSFWVKND